MFDTLLVKPLFNLLAAIYAILPIHDLGLAIIVLTVLIRFILWPLIRKQLHSQRTIQKLQPEVARIKKQAKGDKQLESKMVMELYKEKGISPLAPLVPLIIQLPIFIALFIVLRDVIKPGEIAHLTYEPLKHWGPISDLITGHQKFTPTLLGLINLATPSWFLALLAGAAQFVQTKQIQPKAVKGDAQAQTMATMTYMFPVLTFVIGLTLPAALALYWIFTSVVAIGQQYWILRGDVEEIETPPSKGGK